jgi:integrase
LPTPTTRQASGGDRHLKFYEAQDNLGHSQIGITLDLYSHVTATMQAVAAEAMGRLLGGQDDGGDR